MNFEVIVGFRASEMQIDTPDKNVPEAERIPSVKK